MRCIMEKPRLTELVDLEKDIVPYDISMIYAGVGAGKNSIIVGYHDDDTDYMGLAEKYRVLLITSRKAKVKETKNDKSGRKMLSDVRNMNHIKWDKLKQKSVICTNAHFQKRIADWWEPLFDDKPFWEEFDFVVIDEFHSIVTDATFAGSSCIIYYLIEHLYNECIKRNKDKRHKTKIVLMSGTPEPAEPLLEKYNTHILDHRADALSISPDEYCIFNYQKALKQLLTTLQNGKKAAYYLTVFDKLEDIISEALKIGIKEEQIVVSVSDAKINKMLKKNYKKIFENKEPFETSLAKEKIPDEYLLVITNSKNKEGINIKTKVETLVLETHFNPDIMQICGRFRNGIDSVIIVSDARQFEIQPFYDEEANYQWNYAVETANLYLNQIFEEEHLDPLEESVYPNERVMKFIKYIENSTRFIRYNPFKNKFDANHCFLQAYDFYNKSINDFELFIDDPTRITLYEPSKSISIRIRRNYSDLDEAIEDYFFKKQYNIEKTIFTKQDGVQMLSDLNELLRTTSKNPKVYTQLKSILKVFGYDMQRIGKTEKGQFIIVRFKKDSEESGETD